MHKVVILGCGWLGQQIGISLANAGYQVIGTRQSASSCALLPTQIEPWVLQLPAAEFPVALVSDAIVIVAIPASAANYLQALSQIRNACVSAKQVVFCSSTGIYAGLGGELGENAIPMPGVAQERLSTGPREQEATDLDKAAIASEQPCANMPLTRVQRLMAAEMIMASLTNCLILRLAGLIGPSRHPANFCKHGPLAGADWPVNMVHSADIQQFILLWLQQVTTQQFSVEIFNARQIGSEFNTAEVVNLCCPEHPTKQQFYQAACLHAGVAAPSFFTNESSSVQDQPRTINIKRSLMLSGFDYKFKSPIAAIAHC